MGKIKTKDSVIAMLITNTRRRKRPDSIVDIANNINWLKNELGSLDEVSKLINISNEMLKKFLRVNELSEETRELVKNRKIDSVAVVNKLPEFPEKEQAIIAQEVIQKGLSATDIKVLAPLRRKFPNENITILISKVKDAKPIRHYVLYFEIDDELSAKNIRRRLKAIIGEDNIVSLIIEKGIATLEITSKGRTALSDKAKNKNLTIRDYVESVIK